MGKLHRAVRQIDELIEHEGLDLFQTRGKISMRLGFMLSSVNESTPDDPEKLQRLIDSAERVLGERIYVI